MTAVLLPRSTADRLAWGCLAVGAVVLVAALARYWGANPGHADRLLILVGAAYAAYALAPGWAALPVRPRPLLGVPLILAGIAAFPVGYFLLAQMGPRTLLLWWLAGSLVAAAAGLTLARFGWPRLRAALFPLLFPLFALPIPLRILNPLQDNLQEITTTVSYAALLLIGMEVSREEFVLALPGGRLRVEEACSGVRSVTALTAIAAFVAFLKGFGPGRGALLVALAVPVVAAVNVLRVVLSGLIQEWFGPEYIQEDWHEGLGLAMVLVGLVLVLGIARLLGGTESGTGSGTGSSTAQDTASPSVPEPVPLPVPDFSPRRHGWVAAVLLALGAAGTAALGWLGQAAEEQTAVTAPLEQISPKLGLWTGDDHPVPPVVTDLLAPDRALHRVYTNNVGEMVVVWAFYWNTGAAIKGYHHPDVCWGNKGFKATDKWTESVPVAGGGEVPVTARAFQQGKQRQVVLYWTQEGRRVWTDADEYAAVNDMLTSSVGEHKWVGDLLGVGGRDRGPRLVVVVVAPADTDRAKKEVVRVTKQVADELYRVCPWAAPEPK
jgi:EpsI family protein